MLAEPLLDAKSIAAGQRLLSDAVGWTMPLREALLEIVQNCAFDFEAAAAQLCAHPAAVAAGGFTPDADACRVEFAAGFFDENAVEAAAREKAERVARMTPEERERHERIEASLEQYRKQREDKAHDEGKEGAGEGKEAGSGAVSRVSEQIAEALDMTLPPGLEALLRGGGDGGDGSGGGSVGGGGGSEAGQADERLPGSERSMGEMSQLFEQVLAIEMHRQKHQKEEEEAAAAAAAAASEGEEGSEAATKAAREEKEDAEAPRLRVSDSFYRNTAGPWQRGAKGDGEGGDEGKDGGSGGGGAEGKDDAVAAAKPPAAPGQHFDGGAAEAVAPTQSFDELMDDLARQDAEWQRREGFGGEGGFELPMGAGLDLSLAAAFNSTLQQRVE